MRPTTCSQNYSWSDTGTKNPKTPKPQNPMSIMIFLEVTYHKFN